MASRYSALLVVMLLLAAPRAEPPPGVGPAYFGGLKWRNIGPPRSGYISAPAGIPGDWTTYYAGMPEGGVWKTTNAGVTWRPIFDAVHVASVGAVAVAPSNHDVVYVGTGNQSGWSFTPGNGVYKSTDGGETWTNIGLAASQYIAAIVVDARNADHVMVAALGPRAGGLGAGGRGAPAAAPDPNAERGVYRSSDGGKSWKRVLPDDGSAGAAEVFQDYGDPKIAFALLSSGAVYRSEDGGATWRQSALRGLPDGARISTMSVSGGTGGKRLFALAGSGGRGGGGGVPSRGLYRSDDAGENWTLGTRQLASGGGKVYADPQNHDVVYVMGTAIYRSTDAGQHVAALWGAPSGADPRFLWIDPTNAKRMMAGVDQGAAISVDYGRSWSPYYGIVNGQFYRVATTYDVPYQVCGPQQDSGTACVPSRTDFGILRSNDWSVGGGFENGFLIADPLDKRYLYTQGWYHVLRRYDRVTAQDVVLYQPSPDDRFGGAPPLAFSKDGRTLYLAAQHVLASTDRGVTWRSISPDLAAPKGVTLPAAATVGGGGVAGPAQGGAIQALALSPVSRAVMWAGTSTGLIHVTRDGGKIWTNVTPANLPPAAINIIDASHADAGRAYVALLSRDGHPHLYRTDDYGKNWNEISTGLPDDGTARVVREDVADANLVYAGTVTSALVSFDRGDHWQSLQLNLPNTVVSDMTVHDNDLVISTYGRGFWILDNVAPLRQARAAMASTAPAYLFKPSPASRMRWDNTQDTPVPPEMKVGDNPLEGATVDYYLATPAKEVTLTFSDTAGHQIREFSNVPPPPDTTLANVPEYWLAPPLVLPTAAGMHRVNWDLRYPDPPTLNYGYGGNLLDYREYTLNWHALPGQTYRSTLVGPMVVPGTYTVTLAVDGRSYTQPVTVVADPRVPISQAALEAQFRLQQRMVAGIKATYDAFNYIQQLRKALADDPAAKTLDDALAALVNGPTGFGAAHRDLGRRLNDQLIADLAPPPNVVAAVDAPCRAIDTGLEALKKLQPSFPSGLPSWTPPTAPACGTAGSPLPDRSRR